MALMRILGLTLLIWIPMAAQTAPTSVNRICPVMPDKEVDEDSIVVRHEGKDVRLCCKKCKALFLAEPTRWLPRLPQFGGREGADPESPAAGASGLESGGAAADGPIAPAAASGISDERLEIPWLWRGPFDWGHLHLLMLHFPIALLVVAAAIEGWCLLKRRPLHAGLVPWLLRISALSTYLTVALGLRLADVTPLDDLSRAILDYHRLAGLITAGLVTLVVLFGHLSARRGFRIAYGIALTGAALAVSATGHLGGLL